ncbi:MAG: M48 family metallopeptidase [Patescibacteria group bacterium]
MEIITLDTLEVSYTVQRARRKTIGIRITPRGTIDVSAPYLVPDFLIRRFLLEKKGWILQKLKKQAEIAESGQMITFGNGDYLPFFEETYLLKINTVPNASRPRLYAINKTFQVMLPDTMERHRAEVEVRQLVQDWYLRNTKPVLEQRVLRYADQMGVSYESIKVKDVTSHWGSCSTQKRLNFNYRIAMIPIELCDYIIVHELCHLTEMNHSPRFWRLVEEVIPNYKELRKMLRDRQITLE